MRRRTALWILGGASLAMLLVMMSLDTRMQDAGGWGIIDFELAGGPDGARDILGDWEQDGRDAARLSLWLDFGYLALYGAFWLLAARAVRDAAVERGWAGLARASGWAAWAVVVAATCDAIEDVFLLVVLGGSPGGPAPLLAAVFASVKFLTLAGAIGIVLAGVVRLWRPRTRRIAGGIAALVLAGLVVNAVLVSRETSPAETTDEAPGEIVSQPAGDLFVVDSAPARGGGEAIVLVHGFTLSSASWALSAQRLARSNRVISVDLLGHGRSEKPRDGYAIEDQGRLLADVLRELGVRRALLVGHSLGGAVVVAAAEADPGRVAGIATIGTEPDDTHGEGPGSLRLGLTPIVGQFMHRFLPDAAKRPRLQSAAVGKGVDLPDRWLEDFNRVTHTAFVRSFRAFFDYEDERPLDRRVDALGLPLLVVFGDGDHRSLGERGQSSWDAKDQTELRIAGSGHTPQYERPAETVAVLERFAAQLFD